MFARRVVGGVLIALTGVGVVAASSAALRGTAGPPRIVGAAMLDADRDARADAVRLTYSMPVRHPVDRDGRYPFAVAGYGIRSVRAASGKALMILLVERAKPDPGARPAIRYRRTASKPVVSRAGIQAAAQLFRAVRPHGAPAATTTTTTTTTTSLDSDADGYLDAKDCAPKDARIHPGAPDLPDLAFVDSNCDAIDGDEQDAIFASPNGNDANPGTKEKPKRQIQAAIFAASLSGKNVYAAAGTYTRFEAKTGVGVYGGYDPATWSRSRSQVTVVAGAPEAVLVDDERGVVLQLLTVRATSSGGSVYGIRAINRSAITVEAVSVVAGDGAAGPAGTDGSLGLRGAQGGPGGEGHCDSNQTVGSRWGGSGGKGGASPIGRAGGDGGQGGDVADYGTNAAHAGSPGQIGALGGARGSSGNPGKPGANGQPGDSGANGAQGAGGTSTTAGALTQWVGANGRAGTTGAHGNGGGGGGGGGAQTGIFVRDGPGNGGGGGGAGGGGGSGGAGGRAGGGTFGIYLANSTLVARSSTIAAGNGGPGGKGGAGGAGGVYGSGGRGGTNCTSEVGAGGKGGRGGSGGDGGGGGGGAGGPSIGIFKVAGATASLTDTKVTFGTAGPGGANGIGGTSAAKAEAGIAQAIYPA